MVVCSDFLEEGEVVWLCEGGKGGERNIGNREV